MYSGNIKKGGKYLALLPEKKQLEIIHVFHVNESVLGYSLPDRMGNFYYKIGDIEIVEELCDQ